MEYAVIKPYLVEDGTFDVIVKDLDLMVILAVKDEGFICDKLTTEDRLSGFYRNVTRRTGKTNSDIPH